MTIRPAMKIRLAIHGRVRYCSIPEDVPAGARFEVSFEPPVYARKRGSRWIIRQYRVISGSATTNEWTAISVAEYWL